jgi:O-antigen/teichoic acid export membrane protein
MRNAKLNALSSYMFFFVGALITFFISPLLIGFLGANNFGIWKTVIKFLDFATVADGRSSQALKWVIANKAGQTDNKQKQQAVGSAMRVCILFFPLLLLIVALLIYFLPSTISGLAEEKAIYVQYVGLILGINIVLGPLLAIPDSVLVGSNQGFRSIILRTFWLVVTNVVILYFVFKGYSLLSMAVVMVTTTVLNGLSTYLIATKHIPWLGILRPDKTQFKIFLGFSSWVLVWSFVEKALLTSELLLLGYLAGAELVSSYVFSSYVTQLGLALALMTASALTPSLGRLLGEGNYQKAGNLITSIREINLFISVVIGGGVLILNESFVSLWVGKEFYLGKWINLLIVLAFVQVVLLRGEGQIQDLSLKIKNKVTIGLLSSVLSIFLSIIFYRQSNGEVATIFIGCIAGRLLMTVLFPIMVNEYTGCSKFLLRQYFYAGGILFTCYHINDYLTFTTWWSFMLSAILIGVGLVSLSYFIFLGRKTKMVMFK